MKTYTAADFARWGALGGRKSRRVLSPSQARAMVAARERKRREMELSEWPCQQLLGGTGAAIRENVDGLCKHPECKPTGTELA